MAPPASWLNTKRDAGLQGGNLPRIQHRLLYLDECQSAWRKRRWSGLPSNGQYEDQPEIALWALFNRTKKDVARIAVQDTRRLLGGHEIATQALEGHRVTRQASFIQQDTSNAVVWMAIGRRIVYTLYLAVWEAYSAGACTCKKKPSTGLRSQKSSSPRPRSFPSPSISRRV